MRQLKITDVRPMSGDSAFLLDDGKTSILYDTGFGFTGERLAENVKKACVIGGGVGCAIAYPQAKQLFNSNIHVDVIAGFRNKDIVILENEFKTCCNEFIICTDDGSYGQKGFVTNALRERIEHGADSDVVIAIGPTPMMKFVCDVTKEFNIKTRT